MNKTFSKEFLREVIGFSNVPETELIEDNIVDTSRWSEIHEVVFKHQGKFYRTDYSCGATEMQDESPFEYDDDEIECTEVEPVEVVRIEYQKVTGE